MSRSSSAPGRRPARASLAWVIAAVGLVATGLVLVTSIAYHKDPTIDAVAGSLPLLGSVVAFLLSGAIIASRQPDNIIGWVLMTPGLTLPIAQLASDWLAALDPPPTNANLILWILLWFCSWSWILLIFPIFHLLLTFPSGRLLSPRWRLAVALEALMVGGFVTLAGLMAELAVLVNDEVVWSIPNPVGFLTVDVFDRLVSGPWSVGLLTMTVLSVSAVVLRYRRGTPEARQQLKWPLTAVALFGVVYGVGAAGSGNLGDTILGVLFPVSIAFIPISVAIAVTRYRLYEIDRIISRTIGWALVTGVLVGVFAGGVVALQALLAGFTQGETLAVAASTLVAFALFQPVRRRVQRAVDRRFDRAQYDAERTAVAFAARLRDETDIATVTADLRMTVEASMRPTATDVWLARGRTR